MRQEAGTTTGQSPDGREGETGAELGPRLVNLLGDENEAFGGRFKADESDTSADGLSGIWIQPVPDGRNGASFLITAILVSSGEDGGHPMREEFSIYLDARGAVIDGMVTQNDQVVARLVHPTGAKSFNIPASVEAVSARREAIANEIAAMDVPREEDVTNARIARIQQHGHKGPLSNIEVTANEWTAKRSYLTALTATIDSLRARSRASNEVVDIRTLADNAFLEALVTKLEELKGARGKDSVTADTRTDAAAA